MLNHWSDKEPEEKAASILGVIQWAVVVIACVALIGILSHCAPDVTIPPQEIRRDDGPTVLKAVKLQCKRL